MRNIYNIISEQKSLVDINIASYELNYLAEEFEYVQEGIGESIKNATMKVVEFIKKMIQKIKELVSKVVAYFKKSNSSLSEESLNKDIVEANKKFDEKDNNDNKQKEKGNKKEDTKQHANQHEKDNNDNKQKEKGNKNIKKDNIDAILMTSSLKVKGIRYGSLSKRIIFFNTLLPIHENVYNGIVKNIRYHNQDVSYKNYQNDLFTKLFGDAWEHRNINENLALAVGDQEDDVMRTIYVQEMRKVILEYLRGGEIFITRIKKSEKEIIDNMNELIRKINFKEIKPDETVDEQQIKEMHLLAHTVTLNLGNIFSIFIKSTVKAHNFYTGIAAKAKAHYCNTVLGVR